MDKNKPKNKGARAPGLDVRWKSLSAGWLCSCRTLGQRFPVATFLDAAAQCRDQPLS
jgi:hypothetical protein